MADEPELTPDLARELFSPKQPVPSEPVPASEAQPPGSAGADGLSDDDRELACRYSLSPEDVRRVRGASWAERNEDAQRLAAIAEAETIRGRARAHLRAMEEDNPNLYLEPLLLAGDKAERDAEWIARLHQPPRDERGE